MSVKGEAQSGRRAIVTGASSGIGRETACELAQDGWRVLAVARRKERLEEVERQMPGRIIGFGADLTSPEAPEAILQAAETKMGGVDLLVNNAGTSWASPVASLPTDKLDQILNLNIRALTLMCRSAIPALEKSGHGQIINVSSVADRLPMETLAAYCASKAAVTMYTKVLAKELAPKKIRVNLLSPCGTDTEIFQRAGAQADPASLVPPTDMARLVVLLTKLPESLDLGELAPHKRLEPWW